MSFFQRNSLNCFMSNNNGTYDVDVSFESLRAQNKVHIASHLIFFLFPPVLRVEI